MYSSLLLDTSAVIFFFFNDTATTEIYTLSLHDALPIFVLLQLLLELVGHQEDDQAAQREHDESEKHDQRAHRDVERRVDRSEEHTSELQSRQYLVCRLLLEKKKNTPHWHT